MARGLSDAARRAREREAATLLAAAELYRGNEALTAVARTHLVDLLEHVAGPGRDLVEVHAWDRLVRLAEVAMEPHRQHRPGVGALPDGWGREKGREGY